MSEKWLEHTKTVTLLILVVISFVLTGFLWLSAPGTETKPFTDYTTSYISQDEKHNKRSVYQLASPYQIILHYGGKASWLLPEQGDYATLVQSLYKASFDEPTFISKPNAEMWKKLFSQAPGAELIFPKDISVQIADAFFNNSLIQKYPVTNLDSISRIWLFYDATSQQDYAWFISDQEQKIVQMKVDLNGAILEDKVSQAFNKAGPLLTAIPTSGKGPWDPANDNQPFSRIFYLPNEPFKMEKRMYKLNQFKIDNMKIWLFKDPSVEPYVSKSDEDFYMDNNQLLTYDKKGNTMSYSETPPGDTKTESSNIYNDLKIINNFVKTHHGWTGNYLLDDVNGANYNFRLLVDGFPVYWADTSTIHPDLIQLQTSSNDVSKYNRSLYFLSSMSEKTSEELLPNKDQLLSKLAAQNIALVDVQRIYPGYQALPGKDTRVELNPVWVIVTTSGKQIFISSP